MNARIILVALALQPRHIPWDQLCVTNGAITSTPEGRLAINTASARAIAPTASGTAEIRFTYLGPSEGSRPLASGEMRRQIGLKMRAQDQCNLLYVMWRIEPESKVVVQVKRNPGQNTHAECGAHGYVTIRPQSSALVARIAPGESHVLGAVIDGETLTVTADAKVVWTGSIGNVMEGIDGPVGLRTDNARFELDYYATPNGSRYRCDASDRDAGAD